MPRFSLLALVLLAACVAAPTQAAGAACPVWTTKDEKNVVWSGRVTGAYKVNTAGHGQIIILPAGCTKPDIDWVWVYGKPQVFGGTAGRCQKGATAEVHGKFYEDDEFNDDVAQIDATKVRCR